MMGRRIERILSVGGREADGLSEVGSLHSSYETCESRWSQGSDE